MLPAADVTVALCCDGPQDRAGGMGLFSGAKRVAAQLRRMAEQAGVPCRTRTLTDDPRHGESPALAELSLLLADPTYTPQRTVDPQRPAILYHAADSRQEEAKAAAAAVRACAQRGVPYRRMAVICRDAASYLPALRYEFRLAGIPLFCDEPTTPENTAPARAVHAALDLLRGGVNTAAILRLVKTGLVDLPPEAQCALEKLRYTWTLSAADWARRVHPQPRRLQRPRRRAGGRGAGPGRAGPRLFDAPHPAVCGRRQRRRRDGADPAHLRLSGIPGRARRLKCPGGTAARGGGAARRRRGFAGVERGHVPAGPDGAPGGGGRRGAFRRRVRRPVHAASAHQRHGAYPPKHGQRHLYHRRPHAPAGDRRLLCAGPGGGRVPPDPRRQRPADPRRPGRHDRPGRRPARLL